MLNTTVTNFAELVTPEASAPFVENPTRLTMEQAHALYELIKTFRPEWDRGTVLHQMQITALYSSLDAHQVAAAFLAAASTDKPFEEHEFPGVDRLGNRDN